MAEVTGKTIAEQAAERALNLYDAAQGVLLNAVKEYGPKVVDAILFVVRVNAAQRLLVSFVALAVLLAIMRACYEKFKTTKDETTTFLCVCGMAVVAIISAYPLSEILSLWNWVALFMPEMALTHDAIELLKSKM